MELPQRHPEILAVRIPYASDIKRMWIYRKPFADYVAKARATKEYERFWSEVKGVLDTDRFCRTTKNRHIEAYVSN